MKGCERMERIDDDEHTMHTRSGRSPLPFSHRSVEMWRGARGDFVQKEEKELEMLFSLLSRNQWSSFGSRKNPSSLL